MGTVPASDIYQQLTTAGFTPAQAVVMTAVSLAESGGNDTAVGDVGLENNTWGPSFGLYQVRTLKAQTGSGSDRDISWLTGSDPNQAKAAYDISGGGTNFTPWTTYTSGRYQQFMGQAQTAAAAAGGTGGTSGTGGTTGSSGGTTATPVFNWTDPLGVLGGIGSWLGNITGLSDAEKAALTGARTIAVTGLFAILGVGLVYIGAVRAASPTVRSKEKQLRQAALVVAK